MREVPARLLLRASELWQRRPLRLAYAVLATMVGAPAILVLMYIIVAWLPWTGATMVAIVLGCMLLGAVGVIAVSLGLIWQEVAGTLHVKHD